MAGYYHGYSVVVQFLMARFSNKLGQNGRNWPIGSQDFGGSGSRPPNLPKSERATSQVNSPIQVFIEMYDYGSSGGTKRVLATSNVVPKVDKVYT